MNKIIVPIRGMHCRSCELLIEDEIGQLEGVTKVNVSHTSGKAKVYFEGKQPSRFALEKAIAAAGYEYGSNDHVPWFSRNSLDYLYLFEAAIIVFVLYILGTTFGIFDSSFGTANVSLIMVPVIGLIAGVSTCMALIGGLVLAVAARHSEMHPEATALQKFRPHLFFNLGRIIGFAAFGALIGFLGSSFRLSPKLLAILTILVGFVMVFLGLKLVEIFPALKNRSITLPKFFARLVGLRTDTSEYSHKGAFLTGALTFFLPCGFTQAMQLYAVSTGSFVQGGLIMSLFALGTTPGLLGVGGLSSVFSGKKAKIFFMTAGVTVLALGIFNVKNAWGLVFVRQIKAPAVSASEEVQGPVQEINMVQDYYGYKPNTFTVKKGQKVKWNIESRNSYTCASSLLVPKYGISKNLNKGMNTVYFTPTETGTIAFSCSMGMFRGSITVTN